MKKLSVVTDECLVALAITAGIATIVLLLAAMAVDMSGRQPHAHSEARPQGVAQITKRIFLLSPARVAPEQICHGGVEPVKSVNPLGKNSLVQCEQRQAWSQKGRPSPNYGHALGMVAGSVEFLVAFFMAMLGILAYLASWVHKHYSAKPKRQKLKKITFKLKEEALALAYARGEITEADWQERLSDLHDQKEALENMGGN